MLAGLLILWLGTRLNSKLPFYALLLVAPTYYAFECPTLWSGRILSVSSKNISSPERAESLGFRFSCEECLPIQKAMQQPTWGWGGWGGNRVIGPDGRDQAPTDGMWIIYLGCYGFFGLFCLDDCDAAADLLFRGSLPGTTLGKPYRSALWQSWLRLLGLYMIDCLLNGFLNLGLCCGFRRIDLYAADEFQAEDIDPGFQRR